MWERAAGEDEKERRTARAREVEGRGRVTRAREHKLILDDVWHFGGGGIEERRKARVERESTFKNFFGCCSLPPPSPSPPRDDAHATGNRGSQARTDWQGAGGKRTPSFGPPRPLRTHLFPPQIAGTSFPGHHPGESHHWDLNEFQAGLKVHINTLSPSSVEFDVVGVDASVANALRRIVISEVSRPSPAGLRTGHAGVQQEAKLNSSQVPTVAIETVYVWNNTSIVQDEVLAQRLGLIPLAIDPRKLHMKQSA